MTALAPLLLGSIGSTSYSGVVRLVQWCVIALVFLFFVRVMRAVWVEVRPAGPRQARSNPQNPQHPQNPQYSQNPQNPQSAAAPRAATATSERRGRKGPLFLEVVEPLDRAGERIEVDGEVTVGRSPGCGVPTTYDIYSSTVHARLFHENGRLYVEDLGSTNGTFVNSERISGSTKLGRGDLVQVGATVFQVSR